MEIVNGFPSFSVVSCHLVLTLFALTSLMVLKQLASASVDSLRINKQMSNMKFLRTMFTSSGMELREVAQKVPWARAQIARVPEAARSTTGLGALLLPQRGTPRGQECNLGRLATENTECGITVIRPPLPFLFGCESPSSSRPACRITSHERGNRGGRILLRTRGHRLCKDWLAESCRRFGVACWAYCLIPDHVHLILTPDDSAGLALARAHWLLTRALSIRGGPGAEESQGLPSSVPEPSSLMPFGSRSPTLTLFVRRRRRYATQGVGRTRSG